jgi:hypothetical protein
MFGAVVSGGGGCGVTVMLNDFESERLVASVAEQVTSAVPTP